MKWPLFLLSSLCLPLSVSAQQGISLTEKNTLLQELEKMENVVNEKRLSNRKSAVDAFRAASASNKSAYEFYLACSKELKFTRADARESEYREWRERQESRLKNDESMTALRLQLQWLVITLRYAEGVELETLIPEVETFVSNIVANSEELGSANRILMEPVNRTIFAEAYELNQSLKIENWAYAPGNYQDVYNTVILPFYREEKPDLLPAAWDKKIQLEKYLIESTKEDDKIAMDKWVNEKTPRLYWAKSTDIFQHGHENQAITTMMGILRQQSDHPDATRWIQQLKNLLQSTAPAAPEETTAPEAPAPPAEERPLEQLFEPQG